MNREQQTPPPRRFIAIPFSSGCRSHSSVDVVDTARPGSNGNGKKPHPQGAETGAAATAGSKAESLVARLLRGFRNLSQIFALYDEDEEEEREMVIGLPTDVKHVAHIGWDGSTSTTTSLRSWNSAAPPGPASSSSSSSAPAAAAAVRPPQQQQQPQEQYPLPLPALSMRQFELAMAAQAAAGGGGATATATSGGGSGAAHQRHS